MPPVPEIVVCQPVNEWPGLEYEFAVRFADVESVCAAIVPVPPLAMKVAVLPSTDSMNTRFCCGVLAAVETATLSNSNPEPVNSILVNAIDPLAKILRYACDWRFEPVNEVGVVDVWSEGRPK